MKSRHSPEKSRHSIEETRKEVMLEWPEKNF